jgi:RNA polymerase sigma-70 factor (ECF subfamily)
MQRSPGGAVGGDGGGAGSTGAPLRADPSGETLQALLSELGVAVAPDAELERRLRGAITTARANWPAVAIADDVFLRHLARVRRPGGADTVEQWLAQGTASDLYLACGCAVGDRAAMAAFDTHYLGHLGAALARLALPPWIVDEVKQDVRQAVLVGDGTRAPRIADFSGAGNLRAWLRVVAINSARQFLRRAGRASSWVELADVVPSVANDPEAELLKAQYSEAFRAAFHAALANLLPRDRTLLRQRYLLRLGVGQIAAMYGVNRATVARRLERCNHLLLQSTRRLLAARLGVGGAEIDSILRFARSRLEVSIRSALVS